jgi:hypothetical protein
MRTGLEKSPKETDEVGSVARESDGFSLRSSNKRRRENDAINILFSHVTNTHDGHTNKHSQKSAKLDADLVSTERSAFYTVF